MTRYAAVRAMAVLIVVTLVAGLGVLVWQRTVGDDSPAAAPTGSSTSSATSTPTPSAMPTTAPPVLADLAAADGPSAAGVAAALTGPLSDPAFGAGRGVAVAGESALLLDVDAATPRTPASTTKILTAVAALEALGPDARFSTSVELAAPGRIVLVGGGDPALSQRTAPDESWPYAVTSLDTLAAQTAEALAATGTTTVTLGYRTDLFTGPDVNPAWEGRYVSAGQVGPISALALDGAREQPGLALRTPDPAAYTTQKFAELLGAHGVGVDGEVGTATDAPAAQIATVRSPSVADLVTQMLERSDNDVAEVLAHHIARAEGGEASYAGGGSAVPAVLDRLGVPLDGLVLQDGSGLSRGNRIAPATLVATLQLAIGDERPQLRPVLTGLPVAGFTGTLTERFSDAESSRQVGDVRAKTGYLSGVVSLAGYVVDEDGETLAFAVMADGVGGEQTLDAQQAIDRVAAALAGCGCA